MPLKWVRYGDVFIPSRVKQGQWVELEPKEVKSLYRMGALEQKSLRRGTAREREQMERQFNKRKGPARGGRSGKKR